MMYVLSFYTGEIFLFSRTMTNFASLTWLIVFISSLSCGDAFGDKKFAFHDKRQGMYYI